MQPTLSFQLDGPTGNLQILRTGLLVAELSPDDQLHLLGAIVNAHIQRAAHVRVNGAPPQPILEPVLNPVA